MEFFKANGLMYELPTPAELRVLQAMLDNPDAHHAEIARALGISVKTVEIHVGRMLPKLRCKTSRGLLLRGVELGLGGRLHEHDWRPMRQCRTCGLTEIVEGDSDVHFTA